MKKFGYFLIFVFLLTSCFKPPNDALNFVKHFLNLRRQKQYQLMYTYFHYTFQKDIPFNKYLRIEKLYKQNFGSLLEYEFIGWRRRKNFSFGDQSGRLIVLTFKCKYEFVTKKETFTLLETKTGWKIFDYSVDKFIP